MIALVVDTSVARAASGRPGAGHPSPACTEAMLLITRHGGKAPTYEVVMSDHLFDEWKRHATPFSHKWLAEMRSKRRARFVRPDWPRVLEVRVAARERFPDGRFNAVEKDLPIVELAMSTGKRVISEDVAQRELLAQLVGDVEELKELWWFSPERGEVEPWLHDRAPI